jgi:solute carrier family 35 protein F5
VEEQQVEAFARNCAVAGDGGLVDDVQLSGFGAYIQCRRLCLEENSRTDNGWQTILADNTYSKPFFVTYTNSAFFVLPLLPTLLKMYKDDPDQLRELVRSVRSKARRLTRLRSPETEWKSAADARAESSGLLESNEVESEEAIQELRHSLESLGTHDNEKLTITQTARLAFEFSLLWFFANYMSVACLEYTTVGSATILTSTTSIWTLISGTFLGVEKFSIRKLLGVLASLSGIILISTIDMSAGDNKDRGTFPHKTAKEIAVGDFLALIGAVIYGLYAVFMKKKLGHEGRVSMPVFFGMVGLLNLVMMWPGFFLLHFTGIEIFELPPDSRVITIIIVSSFSIFSASPAYLWI